MPSSWMLVASAIWIWTSLLSGQAFGQGPVWQEELPRGNPGAPPAGASFPGGGAAPPDVAGPGVGRFSFVTGDVSVRRAIDGQVVAAALNAPLMTGDTIATGPNARAELQFDPASRVRFGYEVDARVADLVPGHYRIELAHGTASLSVVRDSRTQPEISTPTVSMRPLARGLYRISVDDNGQTSITVRYGSADVYTRRGTEKVDQGQTMMVRGNPDDPEFQIVQAIQQDEWDQWNEMRDQSLSRGSSYRYMNQTIPGGEDLDAYGSWINDPSYGEVWQPREDSNWAPYQQGQWAWEDYYGWTWVSADPWGWAPYHYGSWFVGPGGGWCWYPGPIASPGFWRPALVAFFGFGGFGVGIGFGGWGNIGWVPLAPFELFHPWYGRGFAPGFGHGYYAGARLANVNLTSMYRNARVTGAMSGVSASAFSSGRFGSVSRITPNQVRSAGLARGALPMAPTANNLRFSNRAASVTPRALNTNSFVGRGAVARGRVQSPGVSGVSGWDRFGSPGRTTAGVGGSQYRGSAGSGSASAGWGRFGSPATAARSGYTAGTAGGYPHFNSGTTAGTGAARGYSSGSSQSLRLSPSMVHNRPYDGASSYRTPSSYGSYNAPRSYSPAANYGASRGAPSSYSAPASRNSASSARYAAPQSHSSGGHASAPAHSGTRGGHHK